MRNRARPVSTLFVLAMTSGCLGAVRSDRSGATPDGGAEGSADRDAGGDAGSDTSPPAIACGVDADCPDQGICGFSFAAACGSRGQCFPAPAAACKSYSPGCACGGTTINIACTGLPSGYAPEPLLDVGACPTPVDGGAPCETSADCAAMQVCAFLDRAPCGTQGVCLTIPPGECPGGPCGCPSQTACTCAGTTTPLGVSCNGLPGGYVTVPIAHWGGC